MASQQNKEQLSEFISGLGPGQLVGRQVLGSPVLGDIQLSLVDKRGNLEVEVIRARGLQSKPGSKRCLTSFSTLGAGEARPEAEAARAPDAEEAPPPA